MQVTHTQMFTSVQPALLVHVKKHSGSVRCLKQRVRNQYIFYHEMFAVKFCFRYYIQVSLAYEKCSLLDWPVKSGVTVIEFAH